MRYADSPQHYPEQYYYKEVAERQGLPPPMPLSPASRRLEFVLNRIVWGWGAERIVNSSPNLPTQDPANQLSERLLSTTVLGLRSTSGRPPGGSLPDPQLWKEAEAATEEV